MTLEEIAMAKIRERYKPEVVLANWRAMNEALPEMHEGELLAALLEEARKPADERRNDVILRLHRRYTKVRQERELEEYLA